MIESGSLRISWASSWQIDSRWPGSVVSGAFLTSSLRFLMRCSGVVMPCSSLTGVANGYQLANLRSQPHRPAVSRPKISKQIMPRRFAIIDDYFPELEDIMAGL